MLLSALGITIFGASELGARLPLALSAVGALMAVYWAGRGLLRARAALLATLALGTMPLFVIEARQLMSDAPLIATLALALGAFGRFAWPPDGRRRARDLRDRARQRRARHLRGRRAARLRASRARDRGGADHRLRPPAQRGGRRDRRRHRAALPGRRGPRRDRRPTAGREHVQPRHARLPAVRPARPGGGGAARLRDDPPRRGQVQLVPGRRARAGARRRRPSRR